MNAVLRRIVRERSEIVADPGDPLADNTPDWLARRWRAAPYSPSLRPRSLGLAGAVLPSAALRSRCPIVQLALHLV